MWLGVSDNKECQAAEEAPSFHIVPFSYGHRGELTLQGGFLVQRLCVAPGRLSVVLVSPHFLHYPSRKSTKISKGSYPPPQHSMRLGVNLYLGEMDGGEEAREGVSPVRCAARGRGEVQLNGWPFPPLSLSTSPKKWTSQSTPRILKSVLGWEDVGWVYFFRSKHKTPNNNFMCNINSSDFISRQVM